MKRVAASELEPVARLLVGKIADDIDIKLSTMRAELNGFFVRVSSAESVGQAANEEMRILARDLQIDLHEVRKAVDQLTIRLGQLDDGLQEANKTINTLLQSARQRDEELRRIRQIQDRMGVIQARQENDVA